MSDRIFLLPGFGEDHRCYRNLEPLLRPGRELVHVDYRPVLRRFKLWDTSAVLMAARLVEFYRIGPGDRLIGHSMGGYFGYVISALQGNPVAMLGSFSDTDKIVRFTHNKIFNYGMTGLGLIKTPIMEQYLNSRVRNRAHLAEMLDIQRNFRTFSNQDMTKMLKISYGEVLLRPREAPLRIHSHDDSVVRPPDEAFVEVPGGHFHLVFHPEEVYSVMEERFL